MSSWQALAEELDRWQALDGVPTLWWRDDDAQADTPALRRLAGLSADYQVPLALAVIPEGVASSLSRVFDDSPGLSALQHGFSHRNHAPPDQRKCELGDHRALTAVVEELVTGQQRLKQQLNQRFQPVLVPPWNRLSEALVGLLKGAGFAGLSTLGPRPSPTHDGLIQVNVHVDLINWRDGRRFAGDGPVLESLVKHLRDRREGRVDRTEATGIMSHHLAHDEACWGFLERLLAFGHDRKLVWCAAGELFNPRV